MADTTIYSQNFGTTNAGLGTIGWTSTIGVTSLNTIAGGTGYTGASGGAGVRFQMSIDTKEVKTQEFNLSSYINIRLLIGEKYQPVTPNDYFTIEYSIDGGSSWVEVISYDGNGAFDWRRTEYSIGGASNSSSFYLRFRSYTEDITDNYLDDMEIIGEPMAFTDTFTLDNFPVKFNNDDDECIDYDQRVFCQLIQQDDPINFAFEPSLIDEEMIFCTSFDSDCCISPGGGETGCDVTDQYWQFTTGGFYSGGWSLGDGMMCNDDGGELFQPNMLTETGTYRVIVTIPGYPDNITNTGSFFVKLGDAVSASTPALAGTYTLYMTVTSLAGNNGIIIYGSDEAVFCISYVSVKKYCTDYSLMVKNYAGVTVGVYDDSDFSVGGEGIQFESGLITTKFTWSSLALLEGCYYLCMVNNCGSGGVEMIQNGDMASSTGWSASGFSSWTYDAINDEYDHPVDPAPFPLIGTFTTPLESGKYYKVTFQVKNYSTGNIRVILGGATSGSIRSANGTYTEIVYLPSSGNGQFWLFPVLFVGSVDNVSVTETEGFCSECYNLRTSHNCTKLLSWTNDDDAFGIPYSSISFTNYLRAVCVVKPSNYPQEQEDYINSGGTGKILYFSSRSAMELFIDDIPKYVHDAIAIGKGHDHFYIDGVEYICEAGYEPEWDETPILKTAKSRFLVYKITQNNKNKLC